MRYVLLVLLCFAWSAPALAAGDKLRKFLSETSSARANFEQVVIGKDAKRMERSSGTMAFARPGKFRWNYAKPYAQLIVGDGRKIWIFDPDLNQVTVKDLNQALGSTPAALLAGGNDIDREFSISDAPSEGGIDWVEARPRGADSSFALVRFGFRAGTLQRMELRDSFEQTTALTFNKFERNPPIAAEQFRFTPPKGADVFGGE
jgi:outer membrane lipoprotein carrier protein